MSEVARIATPYGQLKKRALVMQDFGAAYKAGTFSLAAMKKLVSDGFVPRLTRSAEGSAARRILLESQAIPKTLKAAECQHDLPLEHIDFFLSHGFDPNDPAFLRWVERTEHNTWHTKGIAEKQLGKFNRVWFDWIDTHPSATYGEIYMQFKEMRKNYK